jgi:hypothetical protein
MLVLLWGDIGTVVATLLAGFVYCRWMSAEQRDQFGSMGVWLVDGPSGLLDRHGFLMTIVCGVLIAGAISVLWFTGRPVPGFPIG